ncbi:beta-ketoacyl synthase N-terminal-like domain-containing protein [Aquimarina muelleri]|uniref:Uncharacterized protein n=1 Tax=Aquimarina muelleri TaxID=279356 RepID=A0A918JZP0_9FLAO|nr:beta-ketoacyl synthase N-terminal-like domain-containing protein [Aquimarina muelleri]MCX2763652.1 beta-ketoacyl synthase N-terminal-like domain-containing protein [Aquimarina muelleri]GGX26828.1 hypothetical protein GCM10007384_30040 [Aquimarina muelleri]
MTEETAQNTLQEIKKIFEITLRFSSGKLDVDANFEDFGIDSIISMELINKISKKFNITLAPSKFVNVNTIKELADLLEEEIKEKNENVNNGSDANDLSEIATKSISIKENINLNPTPVKQITPSRAPQGRRLIKESYQELLYYINQKYNIDLSGRSFRSIDDIVDTLLTHHTDNLINYYNTAHKNNEDSLNSKKKLNTTIKEPDHSYDVAIVGLSCNFPDAPNTESFWDNLMDKKNSIQEISKSRWNWEDYYEKTISPGKTVSKWGALIDDVDRFDPDFFNLDPEEALLIDPQERLLMQEVYKAFQDAGIAPKKLAGTDAAVYVAYEYAEYENYLRKNIDKIPVGKYGPVFTSSSPTYYLANRLSFLFDFYGPSESINANCAGSAVAINRAYYSLINNESSVAVVGGASLNLFADDYISLSQYGMLSPTGTCGVFDDDANGFTRGEGVAAVVLKRLEDAERDNNRIYGVIKTSHQSNRGNARFLSEVKHDAITNVITKCYNKSSINPESIKYIEVDGYATKWGDSFEYEGIKNVFKEHESKEKNCALGSVKGNIGNLEAVSGLASFIKLALSLYHKKFPMTISGEKTNTFLDIDNPSHPLYIAKKELTFDTLRKNNGPIRAGLNSFADSGVNLHIVLEEYPVDESVIYPEKVKTPQLFVLSAKDEERLNEYINIYIDYLSKIKEDISFEEMIYTLQVGRDAMDERLAIVASSSIELLEKLTIFKHSSKEESLEKKEIFCGNINLNKENHIINILTKDMVKMMIKQSLETVQWQQLAQLWISGLTIDWKVVWKNKKTRPVSLPTYPFAKEKYWIDIDSVEKPIIKTKQSAVNIKKETITKEAYQPVMKAKWFFFTSNKEDKENNSLKPDEKIEMFLKHEIALQLNKNLDKIPVDINFLDLGMNSIGLITLIAQINDLLQINISPAILFNCPEIKTLTKYLTKNYSEKVKNISITNDKEYADAINSQTKVNPGQVGKIDPQVTRKILVPMQIKGKKRPIFAVPGADGNVITLQHLISALGMRQPFYGLETVGITGENSSLDSIESIAKANIEAVKEIQATGPYRLLGFSNGGTIAYEMARILLSQKEKVESLILIDCISPTLPGGDMIDDLVEGIKSIFINSSGHNITLDVEKIKELPENEIFSYIYDNIKDLGFNFPKDQLAISIDTTIANDKFCRAYKPSKLSDEVKVILFKATQGYIDTYKNASEDYGWNGLLNKPVDIYPIQSNHFSIIDKDNSKKIAKKINALFNKTSKEEKNIPKASLVD